MKRAIDRPQFSEEAKSARFNSSGWYMKVLGTWMDKKMQERLVPLGLSLNQFTIIITLLEKDGLTQVDIGHKTMLPAYATTRNIDKLESLGYVQRKRHESSRRSYRILLTDSGKNLAPALFQTTKSVNDLFLSHLNENQKAEFLRVLRMLATKHKLQT